MLESISPKITDISSIKGVSALLALPMLCVAYFLQTDPSISWDGVVWLGLDSELAPKDQLVRLIIIFVLKSIWVSFFGVVVYGVLTVIHVNINFPVIQLFSVIIIAFSLFGIFCSEQFVQLKLIAPFWFYSLVVWGVFLSSMKEQLDEERKAIDAKIENARKQRSA